MHLRDLPDLPWPPIPWGKIPWDEPGFSERMLHEHLNQANDAGSRRADQIGAAVEWVHRDLLAEKPSRILDLGCGPGLYLVQLARLGHQVMGIDFSPASIRYARQITQDLPVEVVLGDLRTAPFGEGFDLVAFLYSELNAFPREDALKILKKARAAGHTLVLEIRTIENYLREEFPGRRWSLNPNGGLFCGRGHLLLEEAYLDEDALTVTTRFTTIELQTGAVEVFGHTDQAYRDDEWDDLLEEAGWERMLTQESLGTQPDPGFQTIVAR